MNSQLPCSQEKKIGLNSKVFDSDFLTYVKVYNNNQIPHTVKKIISQSYITVAICKDVKFVFHGYLDWKKKPVLTFFP